MWISMNIDEKGTLWDEYLRMVQNLMKKNTRVRISDNQLNKNFMFKKYVLEHKKVVKKFGRKGKRE